MVNKTLLGAIIISGVVAASIIVAVILYRSHKKTEDIEKKYTDELGLTEIKGWFTGKVGGEKKGVLLYPTEDNLKKYNLSNVRPDSNMLIQAVYDTAAEKVLSYREVSFSELSSKLKNLLDENNGAVVIEA